MVPLRLETRERTQVGWQCLDCGHKLPMDWETAPPAKKPVARRDNPERPVVEATQEALALVHHGSLRVGQYRADLSGSDAGMVDLPVHIVGPLWLFVEIKAPGKARPSGCTTEQRRMWAEGKIIVTDDPLEAVRVATRLREMLADLAAKIMEVVDG
jgi:hypothetical protein